MRARSGLLLSLLAAVVVVAGCGPEPDNGIATAGRTPSAVVPTPSIDIEAQMVAYQKCLADHGVAMPEPGKTTPETPTETLRAAFAACRDLVPPEDANEPETAEQFEGRLKTARCMRAAGWPDWPDPVPGSATLKIPRTIDAQSAEVKTAYNKCARDNQPASTPSPS